MLPFHLRLGPVAISPVEIFAVLGIALVGFLSRRRLRTLGVTDATILDFGLAALLGGSIGARLYYVVPLWLRGMTTAGEVFGAWSDGSGFYGGFIGGGLALLAVARWKKLDVAAVADATTAPLPLGFAVGKIGCFLAGCCYGMPWASGVSFRPGSLAYNSQRAAGKIGPDAAASLPVHPTQIYELILGVALFAGLALLQRRSRRRGEVFLAYVAGYSVWRFTIEFFRDDPGRHGFAAGPLSDSQVTALVLGVAAAAAWVRLRLRKPAETPLEAPK